VTKFYLRIYCIDVLERESKFNMEKETIHKNRFTGTVGSITTENPFEIYPKGVYFRSKDGFGFTIKNFGGDLKTLLALKECMNLAYQAGYADCGADMMPKIMWLKSELEQRTKGEQ